MARVMIADDSDAIRHVLKDMVSLGEHELVGEAADGDEAVEKFNTQARLIITGFNYA